jgi:hypothetical protein
MTEEWLHFVKMHVKADFNNGHLYWRMKGKSAIRPIGCIDSNGYVKVQIGYIKTYAHSVIYYLYHGAWPELIDHKNQIRSDNKIENLRETTYSENALNSKVWNTNRTGVKGSSLTPYGKYKVTRQGKHLGNFDTAEEAADAYNKHS